MPLNGTRISTLRETRSFLTRVSLCTRMSFKIESVSSDGAQFGALAVTHVRTVCQRAPEEPGSFVIGNKYNMVECLMCG